MNIFALFFILVLIIVSLGLILFICNVVLNAIFNKKSIPGVSIIGVKDVVSIYKIYGKEKLVKQAINLVKQNNIEQSLAKIFDSHICLKNKASKKVILHAYNLNQKVIEVLNSISAKVEFDSESINELNNLFKVQSNLLIGFLETSSNLDKLQREQKQNKGERDWAIIELKNKLETLSKQLDENNALIPELMSLVLDKIDKALTISSEKIQYH